MEIQIADQRPPLSVAIGLAKKQGESRLPIWEAEMTQMVVEVTRKFHGSITSENVARGLETSIGILGLGLMNASGGAPDAAVWLQHLQQHGIKKTSAQAVELVKRIVDLPSTDYLDPSASFSPTPREQLLYFAKEGYEQLRADEAKRLGNRLQIDLARWLLANTSVGPSARRYMAGVLKEVATVDDVFFYILPRMAQVPLKYLPEQLDPGDEGSYGYDDEEEEMDDYGGGRIKLPAGPWREAKKRYTEFCETLPEALKPALHNEGLDWFEAHVQRTSAETPRRKVAKQPEPEEVEELDEMEAFAEEPGRRRIDEADAMKELLKAIMASEPPKKSPARPKAKKPKATPAAKAAKAAKATKASPAKAKAGKAKKTGT